MAPKSWTTGPQFAYLNSKLQDYLRNQADKKGTHSFKRLTQFFDNLYHEWFLKWPEVDECVLGGTLPPEASGTNDAPFELTEAQEEVLQTAIKDRRQQLKNWFRNTSKGATGAQTRSSQKNVLGSMLRPGKKTRVHKPDEIYQKRYKDKIDALMRVEILKYRVEQKQVVGGRTAQEKDDGEANGSEDEDDDELDAPAHNGTRDVDIGVDKGSKSFKSWHMATRRRVVKEAWEAEPEDVRASVMKDVEDEKAQFAELHNNEKEGLERTAEQRQFVIGNLLKLLQSTCEEIQRLSGWSTTAITGGPNPAFGGQITIQTVSIGETESGASFLASYPEHKQVLNESFIRWLKQVYPKDVRRGLTAPDISEPLIMMDEDDEGINLPAPDASAQPSLDNATSLGIPQHPDNHSVESPNELPLSHSFQIDPVLLALSDPAFVPPTEIFALQDIEDTHLPAATPSEEEDDLAPNIDILRADSPNISSQGQSSPLLTPDAIHAQHPKARVVRPFTFPPDLFSTTTSLSSPPASLTRLLSSPPTTAIRSTSLPPAVVTPLSLSLLSVAATQLTSSAPATVTPFPSLPPARTTPLPSLLLSVAVTRLSSSPPATAPRSPSLPPAGAIPLSPSPLSVADTLPLSLPQPAATAAGLPVGNEHHPEPLPRPTASSGFPSTRPALKPRPEPRPLGTRARGRAPPEHEDGHSQSNQNIETSLADDSNDPNLVRPVSAALRSRIKAINKSQPIIPNGAPTKAKAAHNPDGDYPLHTMAPAHAKRLRVPRKAFGGGVYETTARLDAAAREHGAAEANTSSKRKKTLDSAMPPKKRGRKG